MKNKFAKDSPAEAATMDSTLKRITIQITKYPCKLDKIEEECVAIQKKYLLLQRILKKKTLLH